MGTRRDRRGPRVVLCVQNLSVPEDPRVFREARDLAAAGCRVSVTCPASPGRPRRETLAGFEIFRYPRPPEIGGLAGQVLETAAALVWTTLLVLRLRLGGRIDVLHAANPPDTFFLVAALLRPLGTRFVFDQHDVCPELLLVRSGRRPAQERLLRLLERCSYAMADLVVVPNQSYQRLAVTRGGKSPAQVVVVRSGPDEVTPLLPASPAEPPVVAFAGAMDEQDGVHLVLDAAAELLRGRPGGLRLDLIGAGSNVERLREQAERLGIAESVSWPGWLSGDAFRDRLGRAAVAVSPDEDTPFTRVSTMTKVTDYLGLGLASVVADLPENRVTGGGAVAYYRPGDASDLAARVDELLGDPERRRELQQQAAQRAETLLWRHSARALVEAYENVLGCELAGTGDPFESSYHGKVGQAPDACGVVAHLPSREH